MKKESREEHYNNAHLDFLFFLESYLLSILKKVSEE